ncbi:hypothetical protein BOX15_Mlig027454g1 [Macrostomum lignano]|uniref:Uncharacterized protein n=1 Tax=Macrostomum lignano TaxID=282301 RepID=A0A267FQ91_9PLAT|nr:hypothetical protein BOX15_Mlig027454g1 [Macrostomum lignano]
MVAEHRWCLLATAEAFLTAWLHGHGQCDSFVNRRRLAKFEQAHTTDLPSSIAVSSLRILYHFRVGSFNLAPVHRNPHTPVLVSAVLNRSAGAFVTGESGSFIGVSTADGIEDLFVPEPNVTLFIRARLFLHKNNTVQSVYKMFHCSTCWQCYAGTQRHPCCFPLPSTQLRRLL